MGKIVWDVEKGSKPSRVAVVDIEVSSVCDNVL